MHFGAKRCRACFRYRALALQNAVNTAKNCCAEPWAVVLSVFALAVAGSRAARSLFFPLVFGPSGARARPQPQNAAIYGFVAFAFPGWLAGCSFWAAVSGAPGARATPC